MPYSKPCHRLLTCHICFGKNDDCYSKCHYPFRHFGNLMEHYIQIHNMVLELRCQCGSSFIQAYDFYDHTYWVCTKDILKIQGDSTQTVQLWLEIWSTKKLLGFDFILDLLSPCKFYWVKNQDKILTFQRKN